MAKYRPANLNDVIDKMASMFEATIGNLLATIDVEHNYLHDSKEATFSHVYTGVGSGDVNGILIEATTNECHVVFEFSAGGDSFVDSFSDVTYTGGTVKDYWNRVIPPAKTLTTVGTINPTITDLGTQRLEEYIQGGSGFFQVGGEAKSRVETVIKPGHNLYIRFTKDATGTSNDSVLVTFYEPMAE